MESLQGLFSAEKVVYGTSDHLLNFGEVLLTVWVAEELGGQPLFFNYPKGAEWLFWEIGLFEPYEPPSLDPRKALVEGGLPPIEISFLHQMAEKEVGNLTLGEIAGLIRAERQIQAFRVVNLPDQKPVYVSSKDRRWSEWATRPLKEVINDSRVKLGGAMIYFLYGAFLGRNPSMIGILPGKQASDVLGAFQAGRAAAGGEGRTIQAGEFDFMTAQQWLLWQRDRKWRKAPGWAVRRLLENPSFYEIVRTRLLVGEYCPLAYDEDLDKFFFVQV